MLKSPTVVMLLFISPVMAVSICLKYWGAPILSAYILIIFFLDWSFDHYIVSFFVSCNHLILKSILSDMSITTPVFFWFPFAWNIFFYSLTFSLYVSLDLNWISCRQHVFRFWFCVHSASPCLLVGAFNLFILKVISDMYTPLLPFC